MKLSPNSHQSSPQVVIGCMSRNSDDAGDPQELHPFDDDQRMKFACTSCLGYRNESSRTMFPRLSLQGAQNVVDVDYKQ
jgi:hypothetical protein